MSILSSFNLVSLFQLTVAVKHPLCLLVRRLCIPSHCFYKLVLLLLPHFYLCISLFLVSMNDSPSYPLAVGHRQGEESRALIAPATLVSLLLALSLVLCQEANTRSQFVANEFDLFVGCRG